MIFYVLNHYSHFIFIIKLQLEYNCTECFQWNISQGMMSHQSNGTISNQAEINFIFRLVKKFAQDFNIKKRYTIGIIAFYNEQVSNRSLHKAYTCTL